MNFYIDRAILEAAPRTRLGVVRLGECTVGFGHEKLDEMRLRVVTRMRDEIPNGGALNQVPQIAGVDQLISQFDGDLRRQRTFTEVLIRRLLEGGPLPVENDAIDVSVLLSLYYKLPVFAVDENTLRGDVGLVVGRSGRDFEAAQGGGKHRADGRLILSDEVGYFDSVSARGKRAMVTERTKDILCLAIFPENVGDSIVRDFIRRSGNWFESLCGGEVAAEGMVGEAETSG